MKQEINVIIDFHSHVLPGIDDGARDMETSMEMLKQSAQQGVQVLVATPHFYASRDRVESFLDRRSSALEALRDRITPDLPLIVPGAEIAFFRGISSAKQIEALRIENTDALLLEMPFRRWTGEELDEVTVLIEQRGFQVILAHLERYLPMWENRAIIRQLLEMDLFVQINAEGLLDWKQRGRLVRMFEEGQAHLLGSDCHSLHRRPPNLGEGRVILEKKLGSAFLDEMDRVGEQILTR